MMRSHIFVFGRKVLLLALSVCFVSAPLFADDSAKVERKKAAHRQRRIIMNNDGNDCRKPGLPQTVEGFLSSRTSPLIGSQVDAIFYCSGVFNFYTHKSDETELRKWGDKENLDWGWKLTEMGTDTLSTIVDFCHKNNMEAFWSMRMNDTHDSGDNALLCKWKQEHPELLMGKKGDKTPHGSGRWSAVNYGMEETREKVFRILRDVATRYDVDGLELDFYRHPLYFKAQMSGDPVTQADCDLMTELLRRVRSMTEEVAAKRGHPFLIAARIPDSLGFAKGIGLDVERWLKEDLVDIISGSCYFHLEPWGNFVALGHKYDIPVYACLSGSRIASNKEPETTGEEINKRWNNEAADAWRAGVDGIYTFNLFKPDSPLFRQLGSTSTLINLDPNYTPISGETKNMDRWLKGGSSFLAPDLKTPVKADK